jgi:hypothetical protein
VLVEEVLKAFGSRIRVASPLGAPASRAAARVGERAEVHKVPLACARWRKRDAPSKYGRFPITWTLWHAPRRPQATGHPHGALFRGLIRSSGGPDFRIVLSGSTESWTAPVSIDLFVAQRIHAN